MADAGDDLQAAKDPIVWPGAGQHQGTLQETFARPCYSRSVAAAAVKASRFNAAYGSLGWPHPEADTRQPLVLPCLHVPHGERGRR